MSENIKNKKEILYLVSYPGSKVWFVRKFKDIIMKRIDELKIDNIIDPFGGGGSFILNMYHPKVIRVYNDIDRSLYRLFYVLADEVKREKVINKLKNAYPHKLVFDDFKKNWQQETDDIEFAFKFLYLKLITYQSSGRITSYLPTSKRKAFRPYFSFINKIDNGFDLSQCFKNLACYNMDGIELLEKLANERSLIFLDPPYLIEGKHLYDYGTFTTDQHIKIKEIIEKNKSKYILTETNSELSKIWGEPQLALKLVTSVSYLKFNTRQEYIWSNISLK